MAKMNLLVISMISCIFEENYLYFSNKILLYVNYMFTKPF